jgi:hypothetical protein
MTQSRHLSTIGVSLIALQPSLSAHAQTYPSVVQAAIREARDSCKPEKIELPKDFVTRKDVNGDGVPDFIVDWSVVLCNGTRPNCGSLGCTVTVYASLQNGTYTKALSSLVHSYSFRRINGRPAVVLAFSGDYASCHKDPTTICEITAYWNGKEFASPQYVP